MSDPEGATVIASVINNPSTFISFVNNVFTISPSFAELSQTVKVDFQFSDG